MNREAKGFYINGREFELLVFEKGDRVRPKDNSTMAIEPNGTVESTECNGLFVNVAWDEESYESKDGGKVWLGTKRMIDGLELL
ncbi:hypothetical protein [Clostridium sp.]|uniref:hypothetical protein n=1 Tax=Clostridium sp. TaxID=1506 RepID=UPI001A63469A|nr:hypothetical protein [Clostridium sp.]MBK5242128.1 hypothetical protein [Clostridium sp.]